MIEHFIKLESAKENATWCQINQGLMLGVAKNLAQK